MFKPRDLAQDDYGAPLGAAIALVPPMGAAASPAKPRSRLLQRIKARHAAARTALDSSDWAVDLAEDIGSADWFRGLATMVALGALAVSMAPSDVLLPTAPATAIDAVARDEFRSQMIQPIALGSDSGRRMGAGPAVVPLTSAPQRTAVQVTATLGQGDSFARMLERAGVGAGDAAQVERMIAGVVSPATIAPGTRVDITLGQPADGESLRPLAKLAFRARFDLDLSVERGSSGLALSQHPIRIDTTPLRIRGTVGAGIYRSARAAGAPIEAIQQYLQVIDQHLSLDTEVAPGDTFDIIVAYRRSASGETQVGELLYAGLERGGRPQAQLLRWGGDGQFFEASGMGAQRTGLIMPVVGRITSSFGARRHPILGYTRMHAGIDFGAGYGSPIYAVGDAMVDFSGWHGGHGNYVRLNHGGGYGTGYAHMSRIAVSSGSRVRAGQVIGYVGSTGLSTGPHLHYELYKNGRPVNPLSVRFTVSQQVDAAELAAFKKKLADLKQVAPGAATASLAPRQAVIASASGREIDRLGD
ncbi:peptidase M23-like protein [Novosphingobium kunmingense]|uniref:Peptidase M23-like protein n=1 Tax=Novosphingobium kunmingense TaxID=1211806 RepID=A0A2N0H543_9SPHN|nr:M23 family metallopeptidase [Novosphingobium kunmingense]PKB14042.1 peptidase M23-like protein [Novosphingobium kunmingense]